MIRTAIVTWPDETMTTIAIRAFRDIGNNEYTVQFPDYEWELMCGPINIEWYNADAADIIFEKV